MQSIFVMFAFGFEPRDVFYLLTFVFTFAILSSVGIASGIGLVRRRNWARLLLIGLFGLGIVWQVGSVIAVAFFDFGPVPPDGAEFQKLHVIVTASTLVFSLALTALLAFCVYKLTRRRIVGEFEI